MKKQSFRVVIRIDAEVESAGKPYLTEARVKKQLEKFLATRSITEGIPCHGEATIKVVDVLEGAVREEGKRIMEPPAGFNRR